MRAKTLKNTAFVLLIILIGLCAGLLLKGAQNSVDALLAVFGAAAALIMYVKLIASKNRPNGDGDKVCKEDKNKFSSEPFELKAVELPKKRVFSMKEATQKEILLFKNDSLQNRLFAAAARSVTEAIDTANDIFEFHAALASGAYRAVIFDIEGNEDELDNIVRAVLSNCVRTGTNAKIAAFISPNQSVPARHKTSIDMAISTMVNKIEFEAALRRLLG